MLLSLLTPSIKFALNKLFFIIIDTIIDTGKFRAWKIPAGKSPEGKSPEGKNPAWKIPAGKIPAGKSPGGEYSGGEKFGGENSVCGRDYGRVGKRKEPILSFFPKNYEKKNSGSKRLILYSIV